MENYKTLTCFWIRGGLFEIHLSNEDRLLDLLDIIGWLHWSYNIEEIRINSSTVGPPLSEHLCAS